MSFVPTSGSLTGSSNAALSWANASLGSSAASRSQAPHIIQYPDGWRKGDTEKWYQGQPIKKFTHLQYRKERESPFFHEYIVVELAGGEHVCRFDRRGDVHTRANAFTLEGMKAEDTAHVIAKSDRETNFYQDIEDNSDLLLRIHFPKGEDLLAVLGICFGVQSDDRTKAYTLTRFNCYFLSWTIITATTRRLVDWASLGKDESKWKELVKTTIDGLDNNPTPGNALKAKTRAFFGRKRKTEPEPAPASTPGDLVPFKGTEYLVNTLHKALIATRLILQRSLAELILRTTVQEAMREISYKSAKAAAEEAARSHASWAARDAAMESVIETLWRVMLSAEEGGQIWEDRCCATEECVWKAAAAAADADVKQQSQDPTAPLTPSLGAPPTLSTTTSSAASLSVPPTPSSAKPSERDTEPPRSPVPAAGSWEAAWENAWNDSWHALVASKGISTDSEITSAIISQRAKKAWNTAWTDARRANEKYVPRIAEGVAQYVINHLPGAQLEYLKIEYLKIDTNIRNSVSVRSMMNKALAPEGSDAKLQECIQTRIQDHCQRVASTPLGLVNAATKGEIEEAMRRVWVITTQLTNQPEQVLEIVNETL